MSDEDNQQLITKYRPGTFDGVVGHAEVVGIIQRRLAEASRPHAFLLTGPSGTGKTTIARIIAGELGAEIVEIDAAANSGVEAMRNVVQTAEYIPLSGSVRRMMIIDESHRLSRSAWDTLLKTLEEPPPHLFFALCTTEKNKVPETIKTRCYEINLKPVPNAELFNLLEVIAELEGWQVSADVMQTVVASAQGSPRRALSVLQATHDLKTREDVLAVINVLDTSDPLREVVKLLLRGNKEWSRVRSLLLQAEITDYDQAGESIARYMTNALENTEDERDAQRIWTVLDAFLFPTQTFDKKAAFFDAIGKVMWAG